jgi:endonuclease-3
MSTNRAALISKTHRVLKKHYKPFSPPAERSLFEHILYGCLLQNSAADQADQAFAILLQTYFDWNEVRVTSLNELAERVSCVSDPLHSARRVKISLQNLFEQYYTFNLEEELKNRNQKNLGAAIKFLEVPGVPEFAIQYTTQHGLGGHSIPVNRGVLQACIVLGILSSNEAVKGRVPGLERTIPKAKGVEFASLIHQLGLDFTKSPYSTNVRGILLEIAPDAKERLPKRTKSKKAASAKKKVATKSTPAKKTASKKVGKSPAKKKKKAVTSAVKKKSPSKKLTKKKPK